MCKKLLVLVLVLSIASIASAGPADLAYFDNAGGDNLWENAANWDCYSPAMVPIARKVPDYYAPDPANGGTQVFGALTMNIVAGDNSGARGLLNGQGAGTVLNQAGNLEMNGYWFGQQGSGSTGGMTHNITGGTLRTDGAWGAALEIAAYAGGGGVMNVSGGLVTAPNTLYITTGGAPTGALNISGTGIVSVGSIATFLSASRSNSTMDIAGNGRLVLSGDQKALMLPGGDLFETIMTTSDRITANGANVMPGAFNCWYDPGNDTTIINVPEPATIALLGMGGLALIRRKR